jgi:SAM-dependent methyltransferase
MVFSGESTIRNLIRPLNGLCFCEPIGSASLEARSLLFGGRTLSFKLSVGMVQWSSKNGRNRQRRHWTPEVIKMDQGNAIKKDVQEFYDKLGWEKSDDGFSDASIYEDLRPVAAEYIHRCHQRVKQHLPDSGRYLLDVASGPIQYPEYVAYSAGYERRVCADISLRALVEARKRLGEKGFYVVADIANLPFADNTFDGIVSLHTIYHVPAAEQEKAFNEVHRVLAPERPAVVVYSWGARSPLMLLMLMPFQVWNWLGRRIRARAVSLGRSDSPALYGHHYGYWWFASRKWPFSYELYSWRSVSPDFTKIYVRPRLFGRSLLSLLFRTENAWPRFFGRVGQYPMIVFRKTPAA